MWMIVEKMAFVVNVMSDLLKISAINSNMHAVQPERQNSINISIQSSQITAIFPCSMLQCLFLHTAYHHSDANFKPPFNFMNDIANANAKNVW